MDAAADLEAMDGLPNPRRFWALVTLNAVVVMTVIDGAIANVALPAIARHLQAPVADSIWIVNAYQIGLMVLLLPMASVGEIVGYRRVSQAGMAVFTAASLLCALSGSLGVLIAGRVLQGAGAAACLSVNSALARYVVPRDRLGMAIGAFSFSVGVSASIAPSFASAILLVADWPWLFAVNLPFGIVTLALAHRTLPATPSSGHRFDAASALLSALSLGLLVIAVDALGHAGRGMIAASAGLVSVATGVLLWRRQTGRAAPLLPVDLLRIPAFALAIATSVGSFGAQTLAFVAMPFLLEYGLRHGQVATGLLMTPWPLATALAAPVAGRLADRHPAGLLAGIGLSIMAAGLGALALLPSHPSDGLIGGIMALGGLGFGLFQSPNNRAMLAASPRSRSGGAGGMLSTARTLGQTLGAALVALTFGLLGDRAGPMALGVGAGIAGAAAAVSFSRLHVLR